MIDKSDYTAALRRLAGEYSEYAADIECITQALDDQPVDLTVDMLKMVRNNLRLRLRDALPDCNYRRIKDWAYSSYTCAARALNRGEPLRGVFAPEKLAQFVDQFGDDHCTETEIPTALAERPESRPGKRARRG